MKAGDQPREHTTSWYAATVNEVTDYPELEGQAEAEVCIVGAGFTGVAAALTLAERGHSVALVEANRVGWGASGRNGGQLINGLSGLAKIRKRYGDGIADMLWDLRWRGNAIIRERVRKYAIACDLKDGFVETAVKPRHMRDLEAFAAQLERRGFSHAWELWDREQARAMLGTDAFIGGLVSDYDGHLHPLNLCIGEARAARGLGVRIFEQSPVTGIEHGRRPVVKTGKGRVRAERVILAGNAYHRLEPGHLSNLVFPAGSYIMATEPLSAEIARQINPRDVAVCDMNEILDYYRLSPDRRLLYGGRCNYSGRDPASIRAILAPRMLKIYPQLRGVRVDYEWGGKIGIVLNRVPLLGCIGGNVWYCQGYSGHGINATHILSEVVADAIAGRRQVFDLFAQYPHFRIPGSQWFGNQIIALGMLYFRLKDLL
ncbi:MAG TPA: FAD-binding oxidoreductase [Xanthomonadales bacterium]|nr:FAD-binding oxidoreductase [Xanthomonadales bacterium]